MKFFCISTRHKICNYRACTSRCLTVARKLKTQSNNENPISSSSESSDSSLAASATGAAAAAAGAAAAANLLGSARYSFNVLASSNSMSVTAATANSLLNPLMIECGADATVG